MNPRLTALHRELAALHEEAEALTQLETVTPDQEARLSNMGNLIEAKEKDISDAVALAKRVQSSRAFLDGADIRSISSQVAADLKDGDDKFNEIKKMSRSRARFFSQVTGDQASGQLLAYRFGQFALAALKNRPSAIEYCKKNGIPLMVDFGRGGVSASTEQSEGIPEDGGVLVAPEFENAMIILRELFGVFRRNARNTPMTSDTKSRPRRKGGLTAYFVGEGDAATKSKKGWDRVNLIAKKVMVLTKHTTELGEDTIVDIGDDLAGEIAYAFAKLEDDCGFNGDGSSAYGGITGLRQAIFDVYGAGGGVGLILGSGNAYSELLIKDFTAVVGALPQYAETNNVKWFCHKSFYGNVMLPLMLASGGVTMAEVAQGGPRRFLGYDVEVSQIMPKVAANSQVPALLGDLSLAADFGDRRATTIAMSMHSDFDTDEIGVRGTERFDINNHDVGNATDPGPMVGVVMAAS